MLDRYVLYDDAYSIIYESNGFNDPLLVNFLADFTDEFDEDTISTFVPDGKYYHIIHLEIQIFFLLCIGLSIITMRLFFS